MRRAFKGYRILLVIALTGLCFGACSASVGGGLIGGGLVALLALLLVGGGSSGCGSPVVGPCLSIAPPQEEPAPTPPDAQVGPCLKVAPPVTPCLEVVPHMEVCLSEEPIEACLSLIDPPEARLIPRGVAPDEGLDARAPSRAEVIDKLAARGALPPEIRARLEGRLTKGGS